MTELRLENGLVCARVLPSDGGRVQSVVDRRSGRQLLYQRAPTPGATEFLQGSTGGWDEMFPNDAPWNGNPDHGVVWSTPFRVERHDGQRVELGAVLDAHGLEVQRTIGLLPAPRRGVRVQMTVRASRDTEPFMWTSHPMLAVAPGWVVDAGPGPLRADAILHGRHAPGAAVAGIGAAPAAGQGWSEVVYAQGAASASVADPNGRAITRLTWDHAFLAHLWIVTVTGEADLDLCVLLEPSTASAWRMDEVVRDGDALQLGPGEVRSWWVELESLDPAAAAGAP